MTAYLGPAGNLVPFGCPSEEQIEQADNVSTEMTLGGVQKAQYGRRAARSWRVGIGTTTPEQIGALTGLLRGLYGPPPWVYVGPWAQVSNLLSPASSLLLPGSWGVAGVAAPDPVLLDNGQRPVYSVLNGTGTATTLPRLPVVPGVPVTGSAWLWSSSGHYIEMAFHSASGAQVGVANRLIEEPLPGAPLARQSVTATPPAGAATVELRFPGAMRIAQPAVTWTPDTVAWQLGEGSPKVVARGLSKAVQVAVRDEKALRRTSATFTLDEVGNA